MEETWRLYFGGCKVWFIWSSFVGMKHLRLFFFNESMLGKLRTISPLRMITLICRKVDLRVLFSTCSTVLTWIIRTSPSSIAENTPSGKRFTWKGIKHTLKIWVCNQIPNFCNRISSRGLPTLTRSITEIATIWENSTTFVVFQIYGVAQCLVCLPPFHPLPPRLLMMSFLCRSGFEILN